jgi:nucleotide-binding universal stress UspA family protein
MFSKILVPIDGSENSIRAFNYALYLGKNLNGEITALHIADAPPTVYIQSQKALNELLEKYAKGRNKIFDEYLRLAEKEETKTKTELAFGDPGKEIINYSLKDQSVVIVMGNRGKGHLKEMFRGSVSNTVIHDTKCPVLLVK